MNKIIRIDNSTELYIINTALQTMEIHTTIDKKTFTFDQMNEFIEAYKGINRIYKPMSLLAYTDFKNNNLSNWKYSIKEVE